MLHKVAAIVLALLVALVLVVRYARGRDPAGPRPGAEVQEPAREVEPASQRTPAPAPPVTPRDPPARVDVAPAPKPDAVPAAGDTAWTGTLSGRLDDAVPRPVAGGRLWLHLREAWVEDEPANERDFEAEVRADGTFELTGLPAWRGQIVALCAGWISRPTPFDPLSKGSFRRGRELTFGEIEQAFQEEGGESLEPQRVVVPYPGALVVAMQRTGSLDVTVRGPDGAPLAGALVTASPLVVWFGSGPGAFPLRQWSATTDAAGLARIEGLPPSEALPVGAQRDAFRLTRADRARAPSARIVAGEVATLVLALESQE